MLEQPKVRLKSSSILRLLWCSACPEYSSGKVPKSQTHLGWQREAFLLLSDAPLCRCPWRCAQTWIVGQESPGLRLTRSTRKDIPGSWPNHCVSCLLGSGCIFGLVFLFSAQNPTVFYKGTWSSLFIFKSVLTLTHKGRMLQSWCWKSKLLLTVLCRKGTGRGQDTKAWAQSRFRALTLIFLAWVGLIWSKCYFKHSLL